MSKSTTLQKYQGKGNEIRPHIGQLIVKRGRPFKYKTAIALKKRIDMYFKLCDDNGVPYTLSGLALALGMTRETLLRYETYEYYGFGDIVGKAKTRIENFAEQRLFGNKNCIGAIFALKNNFPGWIEKQETKVTGPLGSILDQIHATSKKLIGTKTKEGNK